MTHILRIDCLDQTGLVHKITGVLYRAGFNIISNHEFVDPISSQFFMRTAFDGDEAAERVVGEVRDLLPQIASVTLARVDRQPIVVMATKEPHCLGDLLLRHEYGELPGTIRAVVSNHETLRPLVERFGIPFHFVDHEKPAHEEAMLEILSPYAPKYIVLAKYMRVLSAGFVDHYPERIINIHHSFLPAFAGAQPYRRAFKRGVKIIGATAHIVTAELDAGPIIAQGTLPVDHTYTASDMAQAGRDVEKIVLAKAVRLVLEERVFLHRNRALVFE